MNLTYVFRVECIHTGKGPYHAPSDLSPRRELAISTFKRQSNDFGCRPCPWDDFVSGFYLNRRHHFGFESLDQLLDWFGDWLEDLEKAEFEVVVYEAPKESIVYGSYQVAFDIGQAVKVGTLTPGC